MYTSLVSAIQVTVSDFMDFSSIFNDCSCYIWVVRDILLNQGTICIYMRLNRLITSLEKSPKVVPLSLSTTSCSPGCVKLDHLGVSSDSERRILFNRHIRNTTIDFLLPQNAWNCIKEQGGKRSLQKAAYTANVFLATLVPSASAPPARTK